MGCPCAGTAITSPPGGIQTAGMGGFNVIDTAEEVADVMQTWFEQGACDGFNITPPRLPGGCEEFVEMVIPVLQRRGLFRSAYDGATLRENLDLPPAVSRYAHASGSPTADVPRRGAIGTGVSGN